MTDFTRRTHLVRVPMDDPPSTGKPNEYIDLEVLDAISFRIENGDEVVLDLDVKRSVPYIVDDTGGGHAKKPADATRRSHMKRITKGDQKLDVEVVDCWAARDQNGDEWILDMQKTSVYDISDGTGSSSTRRAHDETISVPFGKSKADAGEDYLTCQRSDDISFRKVNDDEVIISIPSCDDPHARNVDFGRASTYTTPQNYNPSDDSDSAVAPPLLSVSKDPHNYVSAVKGAAGFLTKDEKIQMGPFWWIRKVVAGQAWAIITATSNGGPPGVSIRTEDGKDFPQSAILFDNTIVRHTVTQDTWYCWLPTQSLPQYQLPGTYPTGNWNGEDGPFCGMDNVANVNVGSESFLDALHGTCWVAGKNSSGFYISEYKPSGALIVIGNGQGITTTQYPFSVLKSNKDYQAYANSGAGGLFFFNSQAAATQMQSIANEAFNAVFRGDGCTVTGTLSWNLGSVPADPIPDQYQRTVIIKLQGVPSTFLLDLTLTGDQRYAQVEVIGQWDGLKLPIVADSNGAIQAPNADFIVDEEVNGAFGTASSGTYAVEVVRSKDTPIPPEKKSPLHIESVTPPL
jgi:hypothetical protein